MRAMMILALMATAAPAWAQDAAGPGATAQETPVQGTTIIAPARTAPVRSTLKPAPDANADRTQPRQRLVTVFGTEKCPEPASPDEIVVCARLPDAEIYRIPKQLRAANNARVSPFQANRNLLLGDASGGAGGSIGSCSANGPGGMIGCSKKEIDSWAQDRTNRMGTQEETPPQ